MPCSGSLFVILVCCSAVHVCWASHLALIVKNLLANAGDVRDVSSIPGLGRSPGGGHSNSLQYSCLENPMVRGVWQAKAHRVSKSQTTELMAWVGYLERTASKQVYYQG